MPGLAGKRRRRAKEQAMSIAWQETMIPVMQKKEKKMLHMMKTKNEDGMTYILKI